MPNPNSNAVLYTERLVPATPEAIFGAFQDPGLLAKWWGPNGFSNEFELFEFFPGGRWTLTMIGPDGTAYPNESVFREVVPKERIVIEHLGAHWFILTVTMEPRPDGTLVTWSQAHRSAEEADRLRAMCEPANEQNLDRLQAVLEG